MGFGRKGRNPTGNELPVVSEGTRLAPSHINQVVAAVDRATIRGGKGFKFSQTSGGTSLKIDRNDYTPPWSIFQYGDKLCIYAGNVWGKGVGQIPLHTTEEWGFGGADFAQKFWTARPVMVGITGTNIVSTEEINSTTTDQMSFIAVPLLAGYYYIEYGRWEGGSRSPIGGATDYEGTDQFILKHATTLSATQEVVVVGYVAPNGAIYQGVKGEIWWGIGSGATHPFKISVRQNAEKVWKIFVDYGTVNNLVPDYQTGGEVGDPDAGMTGLGSGNNVSGTKDIIIQCEYAEGENFPVEYPEVFAATGWDLTPTDDYFYILVGRVTATTEGQGEAARPKFTIEQAVSGSLWVERFKVGDNDAVYWATKI